MKPVVRERNGRLLVFDADESISEPLASLDLPGRPDAYCVAPDGNAVVQVGPAEVVCTDITGAVRWGRAFPPVGKTAVARAGCRFSADAALVWIFRPDALLGRGEGDRWLVLSVVDGSVVAEVALPTAGQGGRLLAHPDGVHMLLDVGEGRDGEHVFVGHLEHDAIAVRELPWHDRCLIDLSPGGGEFMTVGYDRSDVAFHAFPDGEVLHGISLDELGDQEAGEEPRISWSGGYVDSTTVAVGIEYGNDQDRDNQNTGYQTTAYQNTAYQDTAYQNTAYHLVGLADDSRLETIDKPVQPLGDGTLITEDDQGRLSRWTLD
ncbi:MAG: hypothetical protein ABW215_12695 [Kibdelosporangium sp.]